MIRNPAFALALSSALHASIFAVLCARSSSHSEARGWLDAEEETSSSVWDGASLFPLWPSSAVKTEEATIFDASAAVCSRIARPRMNEMSVVEPSRIASSLSPGTEERRICDNAAIGSLVTIPAGSAADMRSAASRQQMHCR